MKLLLLHLSDSHLQENTPFQDFGLYEISKALKQVGKFDECVIVFSGDATQSAKTEQFTHVRTAFVELAKNISSRYLSGKHIDFMVVPGNHDLLLDSVKRKELHIAEHYKNKTIESVFADDINALSNFYSFAGEYGCFEEDKVVDIKRITFGNLSIRFNLINTAPLSLLGSENGDKGLHYLSDQSIRKLNLISEDNYVITVIHHGPEWFCDSVKNRLYSSFIEKSDLLFVGHEHFSLSESKCVNGKSLDVSSGMALWGTKTEHGFNTLLIDTEENTMVGQRFTYLDNRFHPEENLPKKTIRFHNKYGFDFTKEFEECLRLDENDRSDSEYDDYFVFPSLEPLFSNATSSGGVVNSPEKFAALLQTKTKISIEGGSKSGKTILSKYLCRCLSGEEFMPVLINEGTLFGKNTKERIETAFFLQYGKKADFDAFYQLDSVRKILIIDDVDHLIKDIRESLINESEEYFDNIIMLGGHNWNHDINNKAIEQLQSQEVYTMRISPFFYLKREQLISKILDKKDKKFNKEEIVRKINDDITNQIKYFQLTPDFIHQFVDYCLAVPQINTCADTNLFNEVFRSNIAFRIKKNVTDEEDINEILVALDFVAFYVHFVIQRFSMKYAEFEEAVDSYKTTYSNSELDANYVYEVAISSNVLRKSADKLGVEFCDKNLLSFFVAQHLNRELKRNLKNEYFEELLNNLCFGINGDILLFMSYTASDLRILNPIIDHIHCLMNDWDEFSIDTGNIGYLKNTAIKEKTALPNEEEKEKTKEDKEKIEKEIVSRNNVDNESIYQYDVDDVNLFENQICNGLRYLELLAKMLPSFIHILPGEQQSELVQDLYCYPNKLLYFMLAKIESTYGEWVEQVLKDNPKTSKGLLITKGMIDKALMCQSIAYILSLYDFISSTASTKKTIKALNGYKPMSGNSNYQIQNLLMQENVGEFDPFKAKAEKIYDNTEYDIVRQMVKLIARKYFLSHQVEMHGDGEKFAHKLFGEAEKTNIKAVQMRNRLVKK